MAENSPPVYAPQAEKNTASFELTLNSDGLILADRITKTSSNVLQDITYEMLLIGQRLPGISLPPGKTYKKTITITFDNPEVNSLP